jgi:hypothetical protein
MCLGQLVQAHYKQERFAGLAPCGEGQRMPSCLPAKINVAKFNVTTIIPDRMGRADGWARADGLAGPTGSPARTAIGRTGPYRCIVTAPQGQRRQERGRGMRTREWWMTGTATSRPLKFCVPCTSRCGDKDLYL